MTQQIIVTAALPYANGQLHLGHLVEYCQTDMYVRALKQMGKSALYICAIDAHGTPIELKASALNLSPMDLVQGVHRDFIQDFSLYDVCFDRFGSTHHEVNEFLVQEVYQALQHQGILYEKEVVGYYCETDQRFLPDRFIQGTCPKCAAERQYGDVCEVCGTTYTPEDLISCYCALCGRQPVLRPSQHIFVALQKPEIQSFLTSWLDQKILREDVANYVRTWVEQGLRDWCISRDKPYFGFAIPDKKDKYFYVWLDAPIGYLAEVKKWCLEHQQSFSSLWNDPETRIEHVIGKDIVYFHALFWPSVLKYAGYQLPHKIHVHGMLTVTGEKMSKSRGTFITAKQLAELLDPQTFRYFLACKAGLNAEDIDFTKEEFIARINNELVNKHVNLFSRLCQFVYQHFSGRLGQLPFSKQDVFSERNENAIESTYCLVEAQRVVQMAREIEQSYLDKNFALGMRLLCDMSDVGNELMQHQQPWNMIKVDRDKTHALCTVIANICQSIAMYLYPVLPKLATQASQMLGCSIEQMNWTQLFQQERFQLGDKVRLFERIDPKVVEQLIVSPSQLEVPVNPSMVSAQKSSKNSHRAEVTQSVKVSEHSSKDSRVSAWIDFEAFSAVQLKVGQIKQASRVEKSKKLLHLMVDVGEEDCRSIVSGIASAYTPEELIDRQVVVVTNLRPVQMMGIKSEGMILCAGDKPHPPVLLALTEQVPVGTPIS